jgi:hypothetical protein
MNTKLAILSIVAIVTTFAASTTLLALDNQNAYAKDNKCKNESGDGVNVNANVCSVQVCANVNVIGRDNPAKCNN